MIKFDNTEVYGMGSALRGMRNPLRSHAKGDSGMQCMNEEDVEFGYEPNYEFIVGESDLALAKKLVKAGTDHRKFLRQIMVSVDITAPLYWWKEFDTYKVGTVANSESTMHTICNRDFTLDDFSHEHLLPDAESLLEETIEALNEARYIYVNFDKCELDRDTIEGVTKKDIWWQIIQLLPTSYNQMRTCTLNYEVILSQYHARCDHKLDEWHMYCDWAEKLPYFREMCLGE